MKTKQLFLLLILVISACINTIYAGNKCIVDVNSNLNVRFYPNTSGKVIGTLYKGDTINVRNIDNNGWAEVYFSGGIGYVKARYLTEIETESNENEDNSDDSSWLSESNTNFIEFVSNLPINIPKTNSLVFFYTALILWIISGLLYFGKYEEICQHAKRGYIISTCYLLTFIAEIIYFLTYDGYITWFCSPNEVGWIWTIINFFIFGFVTYYQIIYFIEVVTAVDSLGYRGVNYKLGLYSFPAAIVAFLLSEIFADNEYNTLIFIVFLLCQVIQVGMIIYQGVTSKSHPMNIILGVTLYILGYVATTILLINFLILLVLVLIILFFIAALGHKGVSSRYCSNCSHYNNGYCSLHERYVSSDSICDDFRY